MPSLKKLIILPLSEACSIAIPYRDGMTEGQLINLLVIHITEHILNSDEQERFLDENQNLMSVKMSVKRFLDHYTAKYSKDYSRFWEIKEFGDYFGANNSEGNNYFEKIFKEVAKELCWWKCEPM